MTDDMQRLFAGIRKFGWDPNKRERNLREREIDFDDASYVFGGPTIIRQSDRKGEERYMVLDFSMTLKSSSYVHFGVTCVG